MRFWLWKIAQIKLDQQAEKEKKDEKRKLEFEIVSKRFGSQTTFLLVQERRFIASCLSFLLLRITI